jgi:hypothetical protein
MVVAARREPSRVAGTRTAMGLLGIVGKVAGGLKKIRHLQKGQAPA